jgi:hypothetical protein
VNKQWQESKSLGRPPRPDSLPSSSSSTRVFFPTGSAQHLSRGHDTFIEQDMIDAGVTTDENWLHDDFDT